VCCHIFYVATSVTLSGNFENRKNSLFMKGGEQYDN